MNCEQCSFFKGYDWHDGSPNCSYLGGYANCLYKKYIEISKLPNFEIKCSDGKDYVLLPFKHLSDIPTADVAEVKHGEWIHEPPYYAPNGKFLKGSECSNCHSVFISDGNEPYSDHPWCCECGARMDGKINKSATMSDNYNFEIGM